MRHPAQPVLVLVLAASLAALAAPTAACAAPTRSAGDVVLLPEQRAVEFAAVVSAEDFVGAGDMSGYHLVVWEGGGAAHQSLLQARVTDVQVLDALAELGAQAGNGLAIDTWDERHDPDAQAPDRVIVGPPVRVEIRIPGRDEPLAPEDFLEDPGQRGFAMRFGGHRDNIPEWHSGCVVCLYSCPGSKVGNATYTVRDFVRGATAFRPRPGVLPPDGTEVTVRLVLERAA